MESVTFIKPVGDGVTDDTKAVQAVIDGERPSPLRDSDNYSGNDDGTCTSLRRSVLHREQGADRVVYIRCTKTEGHPGHTHKGWLRSWKTSEENGRVTPDA